MKKTALLFILLAAAGVAKAGPPIDPDAHIDSVMRGYPDQVKEMGWIVSVNGYTCHSISSAVPEGRYGHYVIGCDRDRFYYVVDDSGGEWHVRPSR